MTVYDIGDGAEVEFKDGVVHIRGKPPYTNFRISLKDADAEVLTKHLMKELGLYPDIRAKPTKPKKKVTKDEEKED